MKFKFSKNLDYQLDAINAVVEIFDTGKNVVQGSAFGLQAVSPIVANELEIDEVRIVKNVQAIQERHEIEQIAQLDSLDFSVEMETGTGKTYVYLRTALELHKKYGLTKFIVLVPSVAIREGVLKTIEQTKEHFKELYGMGFGYFAYDSGKLSRVREFAQSLDVQIMIMTIQSFNKDDNIMRQTPDRFNGESPLELVAQTRPVVIMDEPQNMESELSKAAISDLNPLFKLRYSATHKHKHNLMYQLTPADAYKKGLVKKIEVFGIHEDDPNTFVFKVREIITQKGKNPQARVTLEIKNAAGEFVLKEMLLGAGVDLKQKTKNNKYEGLLVNEIDARIGRVELSDGKFYHLEHEVNENKEAIFRTQIKETIKTHCDKQQELGKDIKVLSLFFIDRVDNYVQEQGMIRTIFEEELERLKGNYEHYKNVDVKFVHKGYFASKKERGQVVYQNTTGKTKADKEVYDLIMKNKEQLLSFEEPTCFVFSHSALKEGWDNPNIFQICTLNETVSPSKKRQEIGRGLRLAVDINGDRIFDNNVNRLTVVANESYKEFVARLQAEYTEEGYKTMPEPPNARERVAVKFRKHFAAENEDFKVIWEKIRQKTRFNIELKIEAFIDEVVAKVNELSIQNLIVRVDKVIIDMEDSGKVKTVYENSAIGERLAQHVRIENILERIARETGITRKTGMQILAAVSNVGLLFKNPEEYLRSVIVIIKNSLNDIVMNEGLMYTPTGDVWEIELFEDFISYKNKTIESNKSVYERVAFDSDGEKQFAQSLELSPKVIVFTKLPPKFVIDTPLGQYNPDWAIVVKTEQGEKLYLVRETKFGYTNIEEQLPVIEKQKVEFGKKHFQSIGFNNFKLAEKPDLSDLL